MKPTICLAALTLLFLGQTASTQPPSKTVAAVTDPNGNLYVADATGRILKADATGSAILWEAGPVEGISSGSLATDSLGRLYVGSVTPSGGSLAVFGSDGSRISSAATAEPIAAVALDAAGAVYTGGPDSVSKRGSWSVRPPGSVHSLVVDGQGSVFAGGAGFIAKLSPDGSRWEWIYWLTSDAASTEVRSLALAPNGGVYAAGATTSRTLPVRNAAQASMKGLEDAFVVSLSGEGQLAWSSYLGSGSRTAANFLILDPSGLLILGGESDADSFLARFDPSGRALDSRFHLAISPASISLAAGLSGRSASGTQTRAVTSDTLKPHSLTPTTTTLVATPNPSTFGALVSLTATVSSTAATGKVTFYDGVQVLAYVPIAFNGQAFYQTFSLAPGPHQLHARYSGDSTFAASPSASVGQTVTATAGYGFTSGPSISNNSSNFVATGKFTNANTVYSAILDSSANKVAVYSLNGANSTWTSFGSYSVGNGATALSIQDLNGDRYPDIAVANYGDNTLTILLAVPDGNGGITGFTPSAASPVTTDSQPNFIASADFNGDGIPDLAVTDFAANEVQILIGDGVGGFPTAQHHKYTVGSFPWSVTIADVNGDGFADLIVPCGGNSSAYVLLGAGDGTFSTWSVLPVGSSARSAVAADFDGNGQTDIAIANYNDNTISVFLNNSTGYFLSKQPDITLPANTNPWMLKTADFNGDGRPDLAVTGYSGNNVFVFTGNGNGTFSAGPGSPYSVNSGPASLAIGDFNGDGVPDILTSSANGSSLSVLLGTLATGISSGSASQLVFTTVPTSGTAQTALGSVIVQVRDSSGNLVHTSSSAITISSSPSGVGGTVTANAINGIAIFDNLQFAGAGTYQLTASSSGLSSSTSASITVSTATATMTLSSGANPSTLGAQVALTATMMPSTVTGNVLFFDGFNPIGVAPISTGSATLATSALISGARSLRAYYPGSSAYTSAGATLTQTVNAKAVGSFLTSTSGAGTSPQNAATGDFNGDGIPDYATANNNSISICLGKGDGTFTQASGSPISDSNGPTTVVTGDFNGDGKQDLAVSNYFGNNVTVLLGNGSGGFTAASGSPFNAGTTPSAIAVGDFNNDGIEDLAVSDITTGQISILLGDGTGKLTALGTTVSVGSYPGSIVVGDLNSDGNADLVVTANGGQGISVLSGNGHGGFTVNNISLSDGAFSSAIADFDGDGKLDIAVAGNTGIAFLKGNGSGGFSAFTGSPVTVGSSNGFLVAADFNGDGKQDVAFLDSNDLTLVTLLNNSTSGSVSFAAASYSPLSTPNGPGSLAVADFNNDGLPDLIMANAPTNNVTILLGQAAAKLAFTTEPPSNNPIVQTFSAVVQVQDGSGNLITNSSAPVTISSSPSGLAGTLTVNAVNGVATFGNLSFSAGGTYTLTASTPSLTSATSTSISVQGATKLAIATQPPSSATSGQAFTVVAQVETAAGAVVGTSSAAVTIASSPAGVAGTTTVNAVNGVATFSNLTFGPAGSYTLTVSSPGLTSATTSPIAIGAGIPAKLVFTSQPTSVTLGQPFSATVQAQDAAGNPQTSVSCFDILSSAGATVGGTLGLSTSSGLATFSNLTVNQTGTFALTASCTNTAYTITAATSGPITASALVSLNVSPSGAGALSSALTLTAAVNLLNPTGSVTFYDGVAPIGTVGVSGGSATLKTASLAAGVHQLRARYDGDSSNPSVTSASVTESVQGLATTDPVPGAPIPMPGYNLPGGSGNPQLYPGNIATGDFNSDSIADLAILDPAVGAVTIWLGGAQGYTVGSTISLSSLNSFANVVAVADFNLDGKADLAIGGQGQVVILLGDGQGNFSAASASPYSISNNAISMAVADFNGDGRPDLAIGGTPNAVLLLSTSGGGFTAANITNVTSQFCSPWCNYNPGAVTALATADLNGDGNADLVMAGNSRLFGLLGDGAGNFRLTTQFATDSYVPSVLLADLNGDQKTDLVISQYDGRSLAVYLGNGTGGFGSGTTFTLPAPPSQVIAADVDGDGIPDLATALQDTSLNTNSVCFLKGTGNGGFSQPAWNRVTLGSQSAQPWGLVALDFNADGRTDIAALNAAYGIESVSILIGGGDLIATSSHTGNFAAGQPGSYSITVANKGVAASAGQVTVTDVLPSGMTLTGLSGSGWTCALNSGCSRSDSLAPGSSWPAISVSVTAPAVPGSYVNQAVVTTNPGANALSRATTDTTAVTGAATKLSFGSGLDIGGFAPLTVNLTVLVQDANGNTVSGSSAPVTISSNPSGIGGTLTVNAVNGVATFSNLVLSTAGNYSVTATSPGLTTVTSSSYAFLVYATGGKNSTNPTRLEFAIQPTTGAAGQQLTELVVIEETVTGNFASGSTDPITLTSSPLGLSGTTTVNASGGAAGFYGVVFSQPGTYTLTASAPGLTSATSATITIAATPSTVSLTATPASATLGTSVALTATVSPASATGSVTFYDGVNVLGSKPVSGGVAGFSTVGLSAKGHSLTARYSGDAGHSGSLSNTATAAINSIGGVGFAQSTFGISNVVYTTTADIDGDGNPDVVLLAAPSASSNGSVYIYLGKGDGTFTPHPANPIAVGINPAQIVVADLNRDGRPDLIVTDSNLLNGSIQFNSNGLVSVLLQQPGGNFSQSTVNQPASLANYCAPVGLAAGDWNNDGIPDLVVGYACYEGSPVGVFQTFIGNGSGGFVSGQSFDLGAVDPTTGNVPRSIAIGDFNGDGYADLVIGDDHVGQFYTELGDGQGNFHNAPDSPFNVGSGPRQFLTGDFNEDGKTDVAVVNYSDGTVTVLLGDGTGNMTASVGRPAIAQNAEAAVVADFNGDGHLDIALEGNGALTVFYGVGNGTFTTGPSISTSETGIVNSLAAADFNRDGRTDLVADSLSNSAVLFLSRPVTLGIQKTHTGNFAQGQLGAQYSVVVSNTGTAPTVGAVTVADSAPSGMTVTAMSGTGWTCTTLPTCTRNDSLAAGASYPAVTVTVSVALAATSPLVNQATVSGGGSAAPVSASDSTTILSPVPVGLAISGQPASGTAGVTLGTPLTVQVRDAYGNAIGNSTATVTVSSSPSGVTGILSVNAVNGVATFSNLTFPSSGSYTLTASSAGLTSASSTTITVARASLTLALTSSASPAVFGHSVTLTATASSSSATGKVLFTDGSSPLGVASLVNGKAILTTKMLGTGTRSLRATLPASSQFGAAAAALTQTMTEIAIPGFYASTSPAGASPQNAAVGDFNGDGIPDYATANNGSLSIYLGKGDGTFTQASGSPISDPNGANTVVVGDFNGDGKQDLAASNYFNNNVAILLGNGDGTFTAATGSPFSAGVTPDAMAVGDFNNDGVEDIAVANITPQTITLLLGNGSGGFTSGGTTAISSFPGTVSVADFNSDGNTDLVVTDGGGASISVLLGNGSGAFTRTAITVPGSAYSAAVADFDGDGIADIALGGDSSITILKGNGSGGFGSYPGSPFTAGNQDGFLVAADFNGDGAQDLAFLSLNDNTVIVMLNRSGALSPASYSPIAEPNGAGSLAVADFNGDGIPDLIAANAPTNNVEILLGQSVSKLAFTTQPPASGTAGTALSSVVVTIEDAGGNPVTGVSTPVTISSSPSGVAGTLTVNAVHGVATFSGLVFNTPGSYTLSASSGSLNATSNSVSIAPGTAAKLVVTTQAPATATAGTALSFAVQVQDALGNPAPSPQRQITVTSSPAGVTGTLTATTDAATGIATFNNLTFSTPGSYTLTAATNGVTSVSSTPVTVSPGAASQLLFTSQLPSFGTAGATLPSVVVTIEDANGNTVTGASTAVTISSFPSGVTGTLTVNAVNGVATFSNLLFNTFNVYTLTASAGSLNANSSTSIRILPGLPAKLVITTLAPATGTAGAPLASFAVQMQDSLGNVSPTPTQQINVTSSPAGVTGTLTVTDNGVTGIANFTNLTFNTPGTYVLTASSNGLSSVTSTSIVVSAGAAAKLSFSTQPPATGVAGTGLGTVAVSVQDSNGNTVTGSSAPVTIASSPSGVTGTLTVNAVNGVATFSNLAFNTAGSYTLNASASGLSGAASTGIVVSAGAAAKLIFSTQPPVTGVAGTALGTVAVTLQDAFGNTVTGSSAPVTIASSPAGVTGTLTVNAANGVASFTGLAFPASGSYTLNASSPGLTGAMSTSIAVAGASQTISFQAPAGVTFGAAPVSLTATATSGLAVTFATTTPAVCSVSGSTVAILAAGLCSITASQPGNAAYAAATPVPQSFTIAKATPVITWAAPAPITAGTPLSSLQLNASANTAGAFVYTPPSGTILSAGNGQTLSVSFTPADSADYNSATASTTINVTAAATTADVSSQVTVTSSGLVYSRATGYYTGTVTIKNTGSTPIAMPLQAVFTNLSAGATLANQTGVVASGSYSGAPYITVPGNSPLAPGASVAVSIKITYSGSAPISFVAKTLSGSF